MLIGVKTLSDRLPKDIHHNKWGGKRLSGLDIHLNVLHLLGNHALFGHVNTYYEFLEYDLINRQ